MPPEGPIPETLGVSVPKGCSSTYSNCVASEVALDVVPAASVTVTTTSTVPAAAFAALDGARGDAGTVTVSEVGETDWTVAIVDPKLTATFAFDVGSKPLPAIVTVLPPVVGPTADGDSPVATGSGSPAIRLVATWQSSCASPGPEGFVTLGDPRPAARLKPGVAE